MNNNQPSLFCDPAVAEYNRNPPYIYIYKTTCFTLIKTQSVWVFGENNIILHYDFTRAVRLIKSAAPRLFVWFFSKITTEKTPKPFHYDDVIMTMLASQITSLTVVYSIVYSGVNKKKHQSSASLAFVREIHRGPVNFPHKWPVTRKMFPFDDVIMCDCNPPVSARLILLQRVNDTENLSMLSRPDVLNSHSMQRISQHASQSKG